MKSDFTITYSAEVNRVLKLRVSLVLPFVEGGGRSGADPGFLKRGGTQIKDWQNFGTCGDRGCLRGMCPPQKWRKTVIFKINLHDLVHSFCLRCSHKVRRPISAKNRRACAPPAPPSKSAPGDSYRVPVYSQPYLSARACRAVKIPFLIFIFSWQFFFFCPIFFFFSSDFVPIFFFFFF